MSLSQNNGWQIDLGLQPDTLRPDFTVGVFKAVGGIIVNLVWASDGTNSLHVIPEDRDIGEEIGKIITFNLLKQSK